MTPEEVQQKKFEELKRFLIEIEDKHALEFTRLGIDKGQCMLYGIEGIPPDVKYSFHKDCPKHVQEELLLKIKTLFPS